MLLEADDASTVRDYVAAGLGIAILPADGSADPRIATVPIDDEGAVRQMGLTWYSGASLSATARDFAEHTRQLNRRYPGWADLV
ncbi:hypothetical protein KIH74_07805 [Kineosporia sp. J2-2]|uniref:LysR substrate-binding domain-containing protein n=1 Tax=Kineosporia corallincola TaxID=2835133 RepID=A0ABS5TCL5_9ACTN|nr:hypothetical protein [Kineosporia corallincola]